MPRSTKIRLETVREKGNLTVADLARWFKVPYQTVRGWIDRGFEPRGAPQDIAHVMSLLGLLETLVRDKRYLPVPQLPMPERAKYLKKLRMAVLPK